MTVTTMSRKSVMRLSEFISDKLELILDDWERYATQIPAARGMDRDELRDHAKQMLETIAKDLNGAQTSEEQKKKSEGHGQGADSNAPVETAARQHASVRMKAGFPIEDLISEFRALRATVLRHWEKASNTMQQSDMEDMTRFNEAIDQAVAESVARHSALIRHAQDVFLGILGHDLRNPLGAVTMSAQYLMQSPSLEGRHIKAAAMIYNSSKQMSQLVGDLLDFTRTRLGQAIPIRPEPTNIAEIVRHAVAQACAFHPEREIVLHMPAELTGQWDTARIAQVLSNLIANAIKHGSRDQPITVTLGGDDRNVMASVHNMGNPIPADDLPRIFAPLVRATTSSDHEPYDTSLGLGLFIVREIAQAHEGTVAVTSTAEAGTTFTLQLPRMLTGPAATP
jgi:signal transduction histidine kinase